MPNKTAYEPVQTQKFAVVKFWTKENLSRSDLKKEAFIRKLDEKNKGVEYAEVKEKLRRVILSAKNLYAYIFKSDYGFSLSMVTMFIEYENSSDVEELYTLCKRFPDYLPYWSVNFSITEGIYVPYAIDVDDIEDLDLIKSIILSHTTGKKTTRFYNAVIPKKLENVSFGGAYKENDLLCLTFSANDVHYIEEFERTIHDNEKRLTDFLLD